jgi:uncharacterized protein (DUF433 family)
MATAAKLISYPHIEKTPGVRAGKACIAGTRIAVVDVVSASRAGHSLEEIRTIFSSRPLEEGEVYAALGYAADNPHEINDYLQRTEQTEEQIEGLKATYLARRNGP